MGYPRRPAPRSRTKKRGAGLLGDATELADERRSLFLRDLRRENEQDFVRPHDSSFWPSGTPTRARSKELADCERFLRPESREPVLVGKALRGGKLFLAGA